MDYSRLPANSATANGLQKLMAASEVTVVHGCACGSAEYSVIEGDNGNVLLEAREDADCCTVLCFSSHRSFVIHLFDEMENQLFTFRRSSTCFHEEIKVYDSQDALVCVVSQELTFTSFVLHFNDAANRPVLRIKRGLLESNYKLQRADKSDIGVIGRESCSCPSSYYVRFPRDLAVSYKAAVIGACILIDFRRSSRHRNDSCLNI